MYNVRHGYKVVDDSMDRWMSAGAQRRDSLGGVQPFAATYIAGQWTYAEHGPLMVFGDYNSAEAFYGGTYHARIVPAHYIWMRPKNFAILPVWEDNRRYTTQQISDFWKGNNRIQRILQSHPVIGQTLFAAAVCVGYSDTHPEPDVDKLDMIFATYGVRDNA